MAKGDLTGPNGPNDQEAREQHAESGYKQLIISNFNTLEKVVSMGKTTYRYLINAEGKGGETYLTHCQDKEELQKWLEVHERDLIMEKLHVIDKKKHPLLKLFSFKKY